MRDEEEDKRVYKVVLNHEEQYSIWFADRECPPGWREDGKTGSKAECLAHIKEVWTDMRPLSLRKRMEELAANPPPAPAPEPEKPRNPSGIDDLVERLGVQQPIEAVPGGWPTLKDAVERGHLLVRFDATGTELGVRLDRSACDFAAADLEAGTGSAKLVGSLSLNYNVVRFHGELDVATRHGKGRLEFVSVLQPGSQAGAA